MRKLSGLEMKLLKLRLLFISASNARKRAVILKNSDIFAYFGDNCLYASKKVPSEPYLVKIHNNVVIAAEVYFHTHDIFNDMFSEMMGVPKGEVLSEYNMGIIEVFDNVAIGANSVILPNTKIGPNAIVAAGSVVTKDVPEGSIVGGNPARVIGSVDKLIEKRKRIKDAPIDRDSLEEIMKYYWKE